MRTKMIYAGGRYENETFSACLSLQVVIAAGAAAEAATTRFRALLVVLGVSGVIKHPNVGNALVLDVSDVNKRRSDLMAARTAYRRAYL